MVFTTILDKIFFASWCSEQKAGHGGENCVTSGVIVRRSAEGFQRRGEQLLLKLGFRHVQRQEGFI